MSDKKMKKPVIQIKRLSKLFSVNNYELKFKNYGTNLKKKKDFKIRMTMISDSVQYLGFVQT
jgi:hypothetical protein